jgi:undecaprenyl pyrophosphate synthase
MAVLTYKKTSMTKSSNNHGFHPEPGNVPRHVGIIPDGGRRWADLHGCSLREAYDRTRSGLESMVTWLTGYGVGEITIYLSSIQNFKRGDDDLGANLELVESALSNEIARLANRLNLRVCSAGTRDIIPKTLLAEVLKIEESTRNFRSGRLNLLLAYDPIEEVSHAMNTCGDPVGFTGHLWVTTPVDMIIRTGNAPLLSNFLPLQSGYSRLFFLDKLFNDTTIKDLQEILMEFSAIGRKFGE